MTTENLQLYLGMSGFEPQGHSLQYLVIDADRHDDAVLSSETGA